MTSRVVLMVAGVFGALAVVLGAFGAHGLKEKLEAGALASFEVGVRYQLSHALVLLLVGLWLTQAPQGVLRVAAGCFTLGILLFSGSIYVLSTRSLLGLGELRWLGPVTPLGGLLLIAGWVLLTVAAWRTGVRG